MTAVCSCVLHMCMCVYLSTLPEQEIMDCRVFNVRLRTTDIGVVTPYRKQVWYLQS
jgi:hypothetical protein